jgi:hypothetical protein
MVTTLVNKNDGEKAITIVEFSGSMACRCGLIRGKMIEGSCGDAEMET